MKTFFGFILGVLGTSIGVFIAHILSKYRSRDDKFNEAAIRFRSAFVDEIRSIDNRFHGGAVGNEALYEFLKNANTKHERAMIEFRPYLKVEDRAKFDLAWGEYCYPDDEGSKGRPFIAYMGTPRANGYPIYDKIYVLKKINRLLRFADPSKSWLEKFQPLKNIICANRKGG